MDTGLKIRTLLIALALFCVPGCVPPLARSSSMVPSRPVIQVTPAQLKTASAALLLPTKVDRAQVSATLAIKSRPEWTRSAGKTPSQDYARTIERARQDLAVRLALSPSLIQFVHVSTDEFPADTLGCLGPEVTSRPIPAIVSGQVILLEADGLRYTYHARREQRR